VDLFHDRGSLMMIYRSPTMYNYVILNIDEIGKKVKKKKKKKKFKIVK